MSDLSHLPVSLIRLLEQSELLKQGAEAKVYKGVLGRDDKDGAEDGLPRTALLKYRFRKAYRHPTLDALLTRQRIASEGRAILRCLRAGIDVPTIYFTDAKNGLLVLEWIEGWTVKDVLDGIAARSDARQGTTVDSDIPAVEPGVLLSAVGRQIARMHLADTIHGDLTTSNMMLRRSSSLTEPDIVLIDFGLASGVSAQEERAVDLYVLERALASTHAAMDKPTREAQNQSKSIFDSILTGYKEVMSAQGKKGDWDKLVERLEEVRARGRKRSMVG